MSKTIAKAPLNLSEIDKMVLIQPRFNQEQITYVLRFD